MSREIFEKYVEKIKGIKSEADISREIVGLVTLIGKHQGFDLKVNEQEHQSNHNVRLDVGVKVDGLLCGFIEIKKPGKGANPAKFTNQHDRKQWSNLKALPNLIYTDGTEWALYRNGERDKKHNIVRINNDISIETKVSINEKIETSLIGLLRDFFSWEPFVPKEPKKLAKYLAPYSEFLRSEVEILLKTSGSAIRKLATDWRDYFYPDADDLQFADSYAQTVTYALLLARLAGATDLSPRIAAHTLDKNNGLLAQTLEVLVRDEAESEIIVGYSLIQRILEKLDTAKISKVKPDLWIYFYEYFLEEYNPTMRKDFGVYYTPKEIVDLQINLTSKLLETGFRKPLGFADKDVNFIDPAVGTGTYLVKAVEHGLEKVGNNLGEGLISTVARDIVKNMHGFEILVGPYAVAHLRLTQTIENALNFSNSEGEQKEKLDNRLKIYLADTLESPVIEQKRPKTLFDFFSKITAENEEARKLKSDGKILVCIGNPPYNRHEQNVEDTSKEKKGGWIRFGDGEDRPKLYDFLDVDVNTKNSLNFNLQLHNLYNDYVYFWRWALWKLYENQENGGIISFITPSSFLTGPGFAGMRRFMREAFDEMWIIDLGGDQQSPRKTPNVFPSVRIPLAVTIGVRGKISSKDKPAKINYVEIESNTRRGKLNKLKDITEFSDVIWSECSEDLYSPFLPKKLSASENYCDWPKLSNLLPWRHSGIQFNRKWPIAETKDVLKKRWKIFCSFTNEKKKQSFKETIGRNVEKPIIGIDGKIKKMLIECDENTDVPIISSYSFRFLDRRVALFDERLIDRPRPQLTQVFSKENIFFATPVESYGKGPAIFATKDIPDMNFLHRGGKIIPLFLDSESKKPNITSDVLSTLSNNYGYNITANKFMDYVYGILGGRFFVEKYWDELKIPEARVPITKNESLFRSVSKLGKELLNNHTEGWRNLSEGKAKFSKPIPHDNNKYPDKNEISYDGKLKELHIGKGIIKHVHPEVWNYSYANKLIVREWIMNRTKRGSGKKSSVLDDIRPDCWSRDMSMELQKLIWVIEKTILLESKLNSLFEEVIAGICFLEEEFPRPTESEIKGPPKILTESSQLELDL